jgi:hypothetical protein
MKIRFRKLISNLLILKKCLCIHRSGKFLWMEMKLSVCLIKYHTMEMYTRVEMCAVPRNPNLDTGWRQYSASLSGLFTPPKEQIVPNWIGVWMSPWTGLNVVDYRRISCCCRKSNPNSSDVVCDSISSFVHISELALIRPLCFSGYQSILRKYVIIMR